MIIILACDNSYLDRAKALIASIIKNTDHRIYIHTTNVEDDIKHPRISHIKDFISFKSDEHKRDYLANLRPYLFLKYFHLNSPMLWLDSDSLVRGKLNDLEMMIRNNDTVAVDTPEMSLEENQILISTVGLNTTPMAKLFLIEWLIIMEGLRGLTEYLPSIMTVQLAYIRAKEKLKSVKYKDITYRFSDKFFKDETPIWEAQGPRKFRDQKYLALEKEFRMDYENLKSGHP